MLNLLSIWQKELLQMNPKHLLEVLEIKFVLLTPCLQTPKNPEDVFFHLGLLFYLDYELKILIRIIF